jgi:hypothetical protein
MSIERYIKTRLTDKAVYWAVEGYGNDGSITFSDPVEIDCLWTEKIQMIRDDEGHESVSRATVYVGQDLAAHGYLYHGNLDDLSSAEEGDPLTVSAAQEIMVFLKTPSLHIRSEYNRRAML